MFDRVIPDLETLSRSNQPLTLGEKTLIQYLDHYLPKDISFRNDDKLENYNGWLIFVQPFLNGTRPDVIIFNPKVGLQLFEVKDWNLTYYKREDDKFIVTD